MFFLSTRIGINKRLKGGTTDFFEELTLRKIIKWSVTFWTSIVVFVAFSIRMVTLPLLKKASTWGASGAPGKFFTHWRLRSMRAEPWGRLHNLLPLFSPLSQTPNPSLACALSFIHSTGENTPQLKLNPLFNLRESVRGAIRGEGVLHMIIKNPIRIYNM